MSGRDPFAAEVTTWLEADAPNVLSDHVLEAVFAETSRTRQLPRKRWGIGMMRSAPQAAIVAAAAVVVAAVGIGLASRGTAPSAGASGLASSPVGASPSARSAAQSAAPTRTPSPTVAPISGLPGRIVFASRQAENIEVFTVDMQSGTLTRLTTTPEAERGPRWSPDASRIVFSATGADGVSQIFVMNADGSGRTQLTTVDGGASNPAWSPDGRSIVYETGTAGVGDQMLHVMNSDGSGAHPLFDATKVKLFAHDPFWGPGERIAFTGHTGPEPLFPDIYSINPDGSGVRRLTSSTAEVGGGDWSPDGSSILFQSDAGGGCLYRMAADGSGVTRLRPGCVDGFSMVWSPDGTMVAWAGGVHGAAALWVMQADGSNARQLTAPDIFEIDWVAAG